MVRPSFFRATCAGLGDVTTPLFEPLSLHVELTARSRLAMTSRIDDFTSVMYLLDLRASLACVGSAS